MSNEWWRGAVIYQVYPRSFSDTNGDGIGDLPGVTARLAMSPRSASMRSGSRPFFASPQKDWATTSPTTRGVEPTTARWRISTRCSTRAHALGLKVILDEVLAATPPTSIPGSSRAARSRDGPKADWYVWADPQADGTPPNNWLSVFGGRAWAWEPRRRQYYLHKFLASSRS